MKSVFITRDLGTDSIFAKHLVQQDYHVFGQSLVEFSAVPFRTIPACQWIFFYSKTGVDFFFKQVAQSQIRLPEVYYAAMGTATGQQLQQYQQTLHFQGTGDPETTATNFLQLAKGQMVLFPQALHSRQSIQKILAEQIQAESLVVYENQIKANVSIPNYDYLVFTSPMNVQAYLRNASIHPTQKVIAIGKTTAQALIQADKSIKTILAKKPSELALAEAVLSA